MIIKKSQKNHIDIWTLAAVLILMVMSVGIVYSASSYYAQQKWGASELLLGKHAMKVILGFLLIFVAMQVDYRKLKHITKWVLIGSVGLLLVTLATGGEVKGAARWLQLGGFGLQPSELARFALVFHLATLIAEKRERVRDLKTGYVPLLFWIGLVAVLVLLQPSFSTGTMIVVVSVVMLFLAGVQWKHLGLTLVAVLPVLVLYMVSAEYRMRRVTDFLSRFGEGGGKMNHQVQQGMIGFGNGGIFGLGPGGSKQRELYLPESYGDFVFAVIGEEYGLIGTLLIMTLFVVILLRGLKIARMARDEFGRFLALGITSSIALYAAINAGVTLGLLPTTGLPMPFMSYGGSSLLVSAIAVGVLLNISAQTDLHPRMYSAADGTVPLEPTHTPAVGEVY
jgi:cell division protein FtsW